jgi:hypothetical protein
MNKMLRPPAARFPISVRELLLIVAAVVAGLSWYKEHERSRELSLELEGTKRMFNSMLELEDQLREHPEQKSARLSFTEVGHPGPTLHWSMALDVVDDKPPGDNLPVDKPAGDKPLVGKAPVGKAPVDKAPVDKAPVDKAPVDKAPVDKASVGKPPEGNDKTPPPQGVAPNETK